MLACDVEPANRENRWCRVKENNLEKIQVNGPKGRKRNRVYKKDENMTGKRKQECT